MKFLSGKMPCAAYLLRRGVATVLAASSLATLGVLMLAQSDGARLTIVALSTRPDMTSGSDVLVRVTVPAAVSLEQVRIGLNRADATSVFRRDGSTHTLLGLVSGLDSGPNVLHVAVSRRSGNDGAQLASTNHPIVGPVFSGPHEQLFICETASFKLLSGETLGKPLDANCSINRRVDYYYRPSSGHPRPQQPCGRLTPSSPNTAAG